MKRLYKSDTNKVFDGVCGGLGEYFNIDPVIIRLLWVLLVVFGGSGIVAYLVAMFILPRPTSAEREAGKRSYQLHISRRSWGILLIVLGILLLLRYIDPVWGIFAGLTTVMTSTLWPILLLLLGLYLFFNRRDDEPEVKGIGGLFRKEEKLRRDPQDRIIAGVCSGIGRYFDLDANLIRIFWIMGSLASFGFGLLAYLILALFLPSSQTGADNQS